MESAGLRARSIREPRQLKSLVNDSRDEPPAANVFDSSLAVGYEPPKFTIDLSLPPEQRYLHIVRHILPQIRDAELEGLFNSLVADMVPAPVGRAVRILARLILRRVHSAEETAELRGIARATGLPMYLLVAFNVLLDLLLGCTSGGVRAEEGQGQGQGRSGSGRRDDGSRSAKPTTSRMVHFRTLDWAMDPLRHLVVELDYVRRAGGAVVATSVTYFGYVGVLTGVREGLSMSLNFRPYHDASTRWKEFAFRWNQLLVITAWRPSISSVLRSYLIPSEPQPTRTAWLQVWRWAGNGSSKEKSRDAAEDERPNMPHILAELSCSPSTSAYLVFCTPQAAYLVEKDNRSAAVRTSDTFLTAYNHDFADADDETALAAATRDLALHEPGTGMSIIVGSSVDRKRRVDEIVREGVARRRKGRREGSGGAVGMDDVLAIVEDSCISNDETHYAVVMDPCNGKVLWRRVYIVRGLVQ